MIVADKEERIEEAAINAYMDGAAANGEALSDEDRKVYFKKRYADVRSSYKYLMLQREETQCYKDKAHKDQVMTKLTALFRENYDDRVTVVIELRKLGEKVDDPFVPLSKV